MAGGRRAVRELCVAYHSCLKKLVKVPRWSRNHDLCHDLKLLTCPMLIANRQLLFWRRLASSQNSIVKDLANSTIGEAGLTAKNHMQIRVDYDLIGLDLGAVNRADLGNIFAARLERFVRNRSEGAELAVDQGTGGNRDIASRN